MPRTTDAAPGMARGQGRDDAGVEGVAVEHGHGAVQDVGGAEPGTGGHGRPASPVRPWLTRTALGAPVEPEVNSSR